MSILERKVKSFGRISKARVKLLFDLLWVSREPKARSKDVTDGQQAGNPCTLSKQNCGDTCGEHQKLEMEKPASGR